ncbi:hypothetical protein [Diaphorobacter ruginosibacter]|uniref:hypothetical protein n=1 Tax=Diaphorobacter ruginosibacter TaxID=1715720 RepID=UPI00333E5736
MTDQQPLGSRRRGAFSWAAAAFAASALAGCTVVSVTTSVVGLAAGAAIGTVKIVGKGIGKAADAMLDGDEEKDDGSGIRIRYRESSHDAHEAHDEPPGDGLSPARPPDSGWPANVQNPAQ